MVIESPKIAKALKAVKSNESKSLVEFKNPLIYTLEFSCNNNLYNSLFSSVTPIPILPC